MFSQIQQANAQNKAIAARANQTARNAVEEARFNYGLIETRERQDGINRMLKIASRRREGVRERGMIEAQLAEQAGESTALQRRMAIASKIQENEDISGAMAQADFERERGMWERLGVHISAKGGLENARLIKETMTPSSTIMANAGAQLIGALPSGMFGGVSGSTMSPSPSALSSSTGTRPPSSVQAPAASAPKSQQYSSTQVNRGGQFVGNYMSAATHGMANSELIKAMLGIK